MIEVAKNLFVGNEQDFYNSLLCTFKPVKSEREILMNMPEGWAVCHTCKEPFHRMALKYTTNGAPKSHPDYLWSERPGNRLAMNIVDAPKGEFFNKSMMDKAIDFIEEKLNKGFKVLVHCNEGFSRSPSIAMLHLIKSGILKGETLEDCEAEFLKLYPLYKPGKGIREFMVDNFELYKYNLPFL